MKTCRLKIITANIIDDIDTPKIHYISQNKQSKKIISNNNKQDHQVYNNDNITQKENHEIINDRNQIKSKEIINYLERNNEDKIENEKNKDYADENIDINDLCTVSNKGLNIEQKINSIINNIDNNCNVGNDINNNYPYTIMNKKKSNSSLRHLFKNRETKTNTNKNYNKSSHQNLTISKISINNKTKKNSTKNNSKVNLKLNQSVKSIAIKNSKSSDCIQLKKSKSKIKTNKSINEQTNKSKMNFALRSKKKENLDVNENILSMNSWKISEKNDYGNIGQAIDYKILIDDLIIKECNLVKEKEQYIEIFEQKLKPLRELNKQLLNNNEELNREDELNGELILLRSQYEQLFNTLNIEDKKIINDCNNEGMAKKKEENKEFNEKLKIIEDEIKALNDQLKKGELLFVTKPPNYMKLSEEDYNDITLLLKGLFISKHILNSDIIIDKIWKFDKPFQTIYFLVEELFNIFNLEKHDRNKLINYFFNFCKNYSYMNINEFKKGFNKSIGKITIYNKYIYMSKLLNFNKSKLLSLMKSMKKKDVFGRGVINYYTFNSLLYDCGISFNTSDKDFKEILEFLIFCMKKDRKLELFENENEFFESKNIKKESLYDLYYESLNDFINEFNAKEIQNPYFLIRNYMKENDIVNAEKLMRPILSDKNSLVINSVKYIDIIILNKYLRFKGIIKDEDKIEVNTFEEELVDINQFINDIYNEKNEEEKKEEYDELKHKAENLIDDIFKLNF